MYSRYINLLQDQSQLSEEIVVSRAYLYSLQLLDFRATDEVRYKLCLLPPTTRYLVRALAKLHKEQLQENMRFKVSVLSSARARVCVYARLKARF